MDDLTPEIRGMMRSVCGYAPNESSHDREVLEVNLATDTTATILSISSQTWQSRYDKSGSKYKGITFKQYLEQQNRMYRARNKGRAPRQ